jgi:hypothetical protein
MKNAGQVSPSGIASRCPDRVYSAILADLITMGSAGTF